MLRVTADSIRDFQVCPRFYDFKYNDKLSDHPNGRERKIRRYHDIIKKVATFFFYKKQAFAEPSYQALLNRWQRLWFAEGTTAVDVASMSNEIIWNSDTSYTTHAAASLLEFHKQFMESNYDSILIDEPFIVPLNKYIAFEGNFDLVVRETRDDKYVFKIYKWVANSYKKPAYYWNIDMAIADYAFKFKHKNAPMDIEFYIWDFGITNHVHQKQIFPLKDDFIKVKYFANQLLEDKILPSRRGFTSYCKSCPYDKNCLDWKMPV